MKKAEMEFDIGKKRPQVLFLGNGICRTFGGMSWNGLLDELKEKDLYPAAARNYLMPMPLKAAMLTNNQLAAKMQNVVKTREKQDPKVNGFDWSSFVKVTPDMKQQLARLIGSRFDYVLTTNYGYEIESALTGQDNLTESKIKKMMHFHEVDYAQTQFLVNTYNEANGVPVWHVHGEARKPDSIIIGSYYYGKLLRRCVERLDGSFASRDEPKKKSSKTNAFKSLYKQGKPISIGSWIDAFVLGDVYILGFGLDLSESDIWWLLEYKANHRDICGNTYYYEPRKENSGKCVNDESTPCSKQSEFVDERRCKNSLLEHTYGVTMNDLGITAASGEDYKKFFMSAISEIISKVDGRP